MKLCECGCGQGVIKESNKYINGHNRKGKKQPCKDETKNKISLALIGKSKSEKHKINMSKGMIGKKKSPRTEEHKINNSKSLREGSNFEKRNKAISLALTGKNHSKQSKINNSLSHKNSIANQIHVRHLHEERKGKTLEVLLGIDRAKELREESRNRMVNGGSCHAASFIKSPSKPQKKLYEIIKEEFNSAELNFPLILDSGRGYNLDIAIPEYKIAIEYDGSYWHKNKEKDLKRQKECEDYGFKFIRYKDSVPLRECIINDIQKIINV